MLSRARIVAASLALVLLVPAALGATRLLTDIHNGTANEAHAMRNFDAPTYAVADFDKDGVPELVAHNDNQYVYVMSTTRPRILAEFRPDYPGGWGVRPINDPAVADVDNDGKLDIVVVNSAGRVCVYEYKSGSSTTSMSFQKQWCRAMDKYDSPGADAGPAVADVNGDGRMEIFSQVEKKGLFAFNWDGSIRWSKNEWGGNAGPIVEDLDGDGKREVVFFSDGGTVKAYDASTGASKWTFFSRSYVSPASIPVGGAAGDLDGDGKREVVFVARDAHDSSNFKNNHFMLFVVGHNGKLKWRAQPSWGHPMSYTHPVLIDVDGDGKRDILLQDWNTIGHKPGNWERLGDANVFAYKGTNGALLWRTSLPNSWSNDDLGTGDVDGDGKHEVLAIGYSGGKDGMWYLDLRTGAKEAHVSAGSGWQVLRGPVLGNLDGSGKTSWAASYAKLGSNDGGMRVYRTDAACKVGFGGAQNRFGCSGGSGGGGGGGGDPPPPPPPPADGFTFQHGGGNEWWIEVKVSPHPAAVQAMDTGGSWVPLEFKSWGEWAESFHIEPGHDVRFRALSGGKWTESCWFTHPAGVSQCGGGGGSHPPPSGFTFEHGGGNEWWIEGKVSPTPDAVQAMDEGGPWVALEHKPWGEWAESFHIEPGHDVRFRALSGGTWTESCWFAHPSGTSKCGGGGGGGEFSATFRNVRGNEWWVETDVDPSGGTLQGVDARLNKGGWSALDAKPWGSWAKSLHAPDGTQVEFRARATNGQTSQSGTFTWPP